MNAIENNWIEEVGKPAFDSIAGMVEAADLDWERLEELREDCDEDDREELEKLEAEAGDCTDEDDANTRIQDDPLSIELGGWWSPGGEPVPTEYRILLTTGGPAVQITGNLGEHNEASSATLEVQDWGKPWTSFYCDEDVLLSYVGRLYLGE